MKCPYCNAGTQVTNSRSHNTTSVWRRRSCRACGAIWTTKELIDMESSHKLRLSDSSLEPFRRDVLFVSIFDSLSHRKDAVVASSALTDTIITKVLSHHNALVDVSVLIDETHKVLSNFDSTAASVYKAKHTR